jgi:hypothetical protein
MRTTLPAIGELCSGKTDTKRHGDHDRPLRMPITHMTDRPGRFIQGVAAVDDRGDLPGFDELL